MQHIIRNCTVSFYDDEEINECSSSDDPTFNYKYVTLSVYQLKKTDQGNFTLKY